MDVLEPQIDTVDDLRTVLPVTVRIQFQTGSATLVCHTVLDLTKAIVVWISNGQTLQLESFPDDSDFCRL